MSGRNESGEKRKTGETGRWDMVYCEICELGDPGWGDPWFLHWALLLLKPSELAPGVLVVSLCLCFLFGAIFIMAHKLSSCMNWDDTRLSPLALIYPFHPWTGTCHVTALSVWVVFGFVLFCVCVFLCFCVLVCFVSFCALMMTSDSAQDYHRSFTSPLLRPLYRRRPTHDIINQLIPICNSQ